MSFTIFFKKSLHLVVITAMLTSLLGFGHGIVSTGFAHVAEASDISIPDLPSLESIDVQSSSVSSVVNIQTCNVTASANEVLAGTDLTISWTTQGFTRITLNGEVVSGESGSKTFTNVQENTTYRLVASTEDGRSNCTTSVTVRCIQVPPPPTCTLTPPSQTITSGGSVTLNWTTTNAASVSLTDFGSVALSGSQNTGPLSASKTYTLTVVGTNGDTKTCPSVITVTPTPVPSCDTFTASPRTINRGTSSNLTWATTNANRVVINSGIGEVANNGTLSVSPLVTTEYLLTVFGANNTEVSCRTTVTVSTLPVPSCTSFTASPSSLPPGGGNTTLAWTSQNATGASITPNIGTVAVNGSRTISLTTTTTFTLTVTSENNQSNSCPVTVTVEPTVPVPFTCENNVAFSANPTRISRGNDSVLTWSTTGATAVSFNQGLGATGLSGTATVEPRDTTTYIMTVTNGTNTVSCPVTVAVTTSGGSGGGGSSTPTCDLSVSKNSINAGESVTLRYGSGRASDLKLVDSNSKTLVTTKDKISSEKDDLMDGSLKLSPKSDTTYTLTVERGSRERVCKVKVDVKDSVVITQTRGQLPLVSGISLAEVPYTGFEAGPILTMSFYLLLMAWALYLAYLLVIKRDMVGGYKLANHPQVPDRGPEFVRPDVFVASVRAPEVPPSVLSPANLPVGSPVVGYAATSSSNYSPDSSIVTANEVITEIENYAHAKKALLSSDAIRHLMGTTSSAEERIASLNDVITEAKAQYPSEDNWVVINEKRMRDLCLVCQAKPEPSSVTPYVPTVIPEGSGSLAEAIVTGNVIAAYEMIGHRPMFALADASADLDAIYRARKTGAKAGSDLLQIESAKLTDEQILTMIQALTSALDGVYTDEASAVKMAIMKAVKVVA